MAKFPRIDSPCPYKRQLSAVMDGDFCRMCSRDVFDLSGWTDDERAAFLNGCASEVCVRYTLPIRPAIAAAALAVATVTTPAAHAQDTAPAAASAPDEEMEYIIVGGIKDPRNAPLVKIDDPADAAMAELPVVYDDAPDSLPVRATPAA